MKFSVPGIVDRLISCRRIGGAELKERELEDLIQEATAIIASQPMLVEVNAPVTVVGDIHGQFADLIRIFSHNKYPSKTNRYLFLGDYVDRGKMGTETIALLIAFKVLFPNDVFLLRGNHESASITRIYGFYDEMLKRYSINLWKRFTDLFNYLPVAALVDQRILCMHGGLSPHLTDLNQIRHLKRPRDVPDTGIMCDLLWSDPNKDIDFGWGENTRGISFNFATNVVVDFCKEHKLDLIIRAHQVNQPFRIWGTFTNFLHVQKPLSALLPALCIVSILFYQTAMQKYTLYVTDNA